MNILFTICGRAGSKGIRNKNIRDFCGKPLPYYSLAAIDMYIDRYAADPSDYDIVLSTDSPELIKLIQDNPFRPVDVIDRSADLAGDAVAKKDVILDCLTRMEGKKSCVYDLVVDLDITSPLRTVEDIKELIDISLKTGADITYSVTDSRRSPYFNQVIKGEKGYNVVIPSQFTARQQAPEVFDMNASLYAYRPDHLKNGGGFVGGYYEVIKMRDTAVLDLDHESDFELMEIIAAYMYDRYPEMGEIFKHIPG